VNSVGTPPEVFVNENLTWGDDHAHLVVVTVNGTDAVAADAAPTDAAPTDVPAPVADASSDDGDGTIVARADGTVETVIIQRESLTFVAGATGVEGAGLTGVEAAALAAGGPGAFIVVDTNGVAGLAGVRYVLGGDMLTEIASGGTATIEAPAGETSDAETAAGEANLPATGVASSDVAIAAEIADIAGVLSVRVVGPGLIEVVGDATAADLADRIGAVGGVISVADDVLFSTTVDPLQNQQWAIANTGSPSQAGEWPGVAGADIAAPAAWTVANGTGVTVAVIDTGVELTHPDLVTRMWTNTAETSCTNGVDDDANGFVDDCNGWDFGVGDKDPNPDPPSPSAQGDEAQAAAARAAHGTHVAGIIAAAANGVGIVGVAPGAKIMALKVSNLAGQIPGVNTTAAVRYARLNGAKVINISLASPVVPRANILALETEIKLATDAGVVVVAAAGNNGADITNNAVWPAGLSVFNPGVITAGASTNSDTLASFSNWGAPISLVAPGWFIMSSVLNSSWGFMSGTSMAAPYVAGSAAVVMSSGQVTTPAAVRTRLVSTADTTTAGKRLNVAAAVGVTRGAGVAPALAVTYTGAGALVPDTSGTLGMRVSAGPSSSVTQVRLSIATREGGAVAAVEGVRASFSDSSGALASAATSALGAFPAVALRDTSGLHNAGATVSTNLNLPAGDYAFVTELLTAGGVSVGGAQVAYLTVSAVPAAGGGTVPASTVASNPLVPTTTPTSGGTPVTNPPAPGGTGTTVPPVTAPGGGGGGGTPPTTSPPAPVPTTPGTGNPATTAPSTPPAPAVTAPITTNPGAPVTTAPAGGSGGTVPAITSPPATTPATTTAPATPAPPVTTPPPPPALDGNYSAVSMNPRISSMCGGTSLTITGQFPTTVPVYVWFGTQGPVSEATVTESQLTVQAPAVLNARIVDVSVRFTLARPYALTLTSALTYTTATCSSGSGATTTTVAAGGGGTPATTTPPTTPRTTSPATPGTTSPATPGTTTPPVTSPVTIPGVQGGAVVGTRRGLTLRTPAAGGVLARLTVSAWPTAGCRQSTCAAAGL